MVGGHGGQDPLQSAQESPLRSRAQPLSGWELDLEGFCHPRQRDVCGAPDPSRQLVRPWLCKGR